MSNVDLSDFEKEVGFFIVAPPSPEEEGEEEGTQDVTDATAPPPSAAQRHSVVRLPGMVAPAPRRSAVAPGIMMSTRGGSFAGSFAAARISQCQLHTLVTVNGGSLLDAADGQVRYAAPRPSQAAIMTARASRRGVSFIMPPAAGAALAGQGLTVPAAFARRSAYAGAPPTSNLRPAAHALPPSLMPHPHISLPAALAAVSETPAALPSDLPTALAPSPAQAGTSPPHHHNADPTRMAGAMSRGGSVYARQSFGAALMGRISGVFAPSYQYGEGVLKQAADRESVATERVSWLHNVMWRGSVASVSSDRTSWLPAAGAMRMAGALSRGGSLAIGIARRSTLYAPPDGATPAIAIPAGRSGGGGTGPAPPPATTSTLFAAMTEGLEEAASGALGPTEKPVKAQAALGMGPAADIASGCGPPQPTFSVSKPPAARAKGLTSPSSLTAALAAACATGNSSPASGASQGGTTPTSL